MRPRPQVVAEVVYNEAVRCQKGVCCMVVVARL